MKNIKKLLSLIICIAVVFATLPISGALVANAETTTLNGATLTYTVSNGKATIIDCDETISGDVILPDTLGGYPVTSIGDRAFYDCYKFTSIVIPDSVTSIGHYAFCYCRGLTSIVIPNGVTSIGSSAFSDCASLTSITIPDGVTSIGGAAFSCCSSLTSITIDSENTAYTSIDGVLFNKGKTELICYPAGRDNTAYIIPDSVTSIGNVAFYECSSLTSITIPDGVTSIGKYAFSNCDSLTSITIPDSVTSIGSNTFAYCDNLTCITIPDGVTSIGKYAFEYCGNLTGITIPDSVTIIGDCAFSRCTSLTSITIPDSVTSIGDYTFYFCESLRSIIIPDSVTSIGIYAFSYCDSLTDVYYGGTQDDWSKISIGDYNEYLKDANIHYHTHSGEWVVTSAPTCTEEGERYRVCAECGDIKTETIPALGHSFSADYTVGKQPTCTQTGEKYKVCTACGEKREIETISALGHSFSADYTVGKQPTCTQPGEKYKVCTVCGEKREIEVIPALGHSFSADYTVEKQPTCTQSGEKYKVCTVCGEKSETEVIPALGHSYSAEYTVDIPATDLTDGSKSRHCVRCDAVTDVTVIEKLSVANGVCAGGAEWIVRKNGVLIIKGNGAVDNYKLFSYAPWSGYAESITRIEIGGGITHIGYYAFNGLENVSDIIIDNPDMTFGEYYALPDDTSAITIYCLGGSEVEEYADKNGITLIKPENPEIPSAPELELRSGSYVVLKAVNGYEYSLDGKVWQSSNAFEGLAEGTAYSFYCRIAEGAYSASAASEALVVTTLSAPEAPVLMVKGNTVTLEPLDGYEYSLDGKIWQSNNVFTGLTYDTMLYFYQRKSASGKDTASPSSAAAIAIAVSAPRVLVGNGMLKVAFTEGYEYCLEDLTWQDSNVFTKLIPGMSYTVYQRVKNTSGIYTDTEPMGTEVTVNGSNVITEPESSHLVWLRRLLLKGGSNDIAADINGDDSINIKDLIALKKLIAA